jgi:hypothetical protein
MNQRTSAIAEKLTTEDPTPTLYNKRQ